MRLIDLVGLRAEAREQGWVAAPGSLDDVRAAMLRQGWQEVAMRRGEPPAPSLTPKSVSDARPGSMSAIYGRGQQPLHTDGAHLLDPPDLVLLVCDQANLTPTLLWRLTPGAAYRQLGGHLHDGIFVVRNGKDSFLTAAGLGSGIRYDPGCMTPCDQRARHISQALHDAAAEAEVHEWTKPGSLLVIDNRNTLHARGAVRTGDDGRSLQRIAIATGGQTR